MRYTVVPLQVGVSTHNNSDRPITQVPESLVGKPFTQVVSNHSSPVRFRFLSGGNVYIVTPPAAVHQVSRRWPGGPSCAGAPIPGR